MEQLGPWAESVRQKLRHDVLGRRRQRAWRPDIWRLLCLGSRSPSPWDQESGQQETWCLRPGLGQCQAGPWQEAQGCSGTETNQREEAAEPVSESGLGSFLLPFPLCQIL